MTSTVLYQLKLSRMGHEISQGLSAVQVQYRVVQFCCLRLISHATKRGFPPNMRSGASCIKALLCTDRHPCNHTST